MKYRTQLIPKTRRQRPGYALKPTSITVHNTANPNATAANHADWLCRENTSASAHIFVDDIEAVMVIPLTEQAWHAGINAGNTTSVGIEVCEFSTRSRQDKTDDNAQALIAAMLTGKAPKGWNCQVGLKAVRSHQSWRQYGPSKPGKYCPRMILPWWDRFKAEIGVLMGATPPATGGGSTVPAKNKIVQGFVRPAQVAAAVAALAKLGIRAYVIDADTARIERKNPEGDPQ